MYKGKLAAELPTIVAARAFYGCMTILTGRRMSRMADLRVIEHVEPHARKTGQLQQFESRHSVVDALRSEYYRSAARRDLGWLREQSSG